MATNEHHLGDTTLTETPVAAETSSTTLPTGSTETGLSRTQRAKQGLKNATKDKKKVALASAAVVAVAGAAAGLLTRSRRKSAAGDGDGSPGLYASPEISTGTGIEDRTLKQAEKARKKEEKEKKKAAKDAKKSKSH
ncbi:MAG TPA: hypothetical protein VE685_25960 [Thermoanaerobaculia bacterium]|nr:hypothetical protein [Thermoanaerobaculia bacterium]